MNFFRIAFAFLLIIATCFALRLTAAELYFGYANSQTSLCQANSCLADSAIKQALLLWPGQPRYLSVQAKIQSQLGRHEDAIASYQAAQSRQPTWPYHSLNALKQFERLDRFRGPQVNAAWRHVAKTGLVERPVLISASEFALRHWYRLGPDERESAMSLLNALANHDGKRLYRIAQVENRVLLLCRIGRFTGCHDSV